MLSIRRPIEAEMTRFTEMRQQLLSSDNPLLALALAHVSRRVGKMMRPMLTFLMCKGLGQSGDAMYHAALALELLHTASLVHDDVVDESGERRGQPSVNALFDNKAAVLVGDYILSSSLREGARTRSTSFIDILGHLCQDLADGELLQMHNMDEEEITESQYFEVVRRKTASLFATAAVVPVCLRHPTLNSLPSSARLSDSETPQSVRQQLSTLNSQLSTLNSPSYRLGEKIGVLFQIRDDIFDLTQDAAIGKPTGNDLLEGKLTLPVIYAVNNDPSLRDAAMRVRHLESSPADRELLAEAARCTGLDYAEQCINRLLTEAHALASSLVGDDSDVALALHSYIDYSARRNR